jgi:VWFA-related protein
MKIRSSLFLALSLVALSCLRDPDAAQQPSTTEPTTNIKVQAREVLLPVTVIDKHGALVTNLTAKDFTLTEDGRPQVIKSFTTQSNLPFRLGLLVDTSRSVYSAIDNERKAAEKFVEQMLPADPKAGAPGDGSMSPGSRAGVRGGEAFLIHFDSEVELLEDFTESREKLDHEIDAMTPTSREHNNQGPETSGDDRGSGDHGASRGGGTQLYDAIYLSSDELMKPKDGRKALVVFSDGVDRGSKETLNDAIDAADRAGVQVFTIYFKGEEDRGENGFPGGGHHGGMGGGGYPGGGYPGGGGGWPGGGGGGRHPGGNNAPQLDGKKIMQEIASRTGGQFFEAKKKDNLEDIYGLIAGALRQQYLLTYTPDQVDAEGDFHKIALKTGNSDLTVITREGYYPPTPDK